MKRRHVQLQQKRSVLPNCRRSMRALRCVATPRLKNRGSRTRKVFPGSFLTSGESTINDDGADLGAIRNAESACCTPATPQGVCCAPKQELAADAPCCGPKADARV